MNQLRAGFSRVNITPPMGIPMEGYFVPRFADGVLDDLYANVLALTLGETRLLLISVDNCGIPQALLNIYRAQISQVAGVPAEAVFIACTHTHTGPSVHAKPEDGMQRAYSAFLLGRLKDASRFALEDCKPARMGWAMGSAPHIAFVRRFRMKDGSIQTNPGTNNPDIVEPIGAVDERVHVLRFDRDGGDTLVLANFANHPDVVGGCKISTDWPGLFRSSFEKAIENTRCIFFNGAQGDVNHINVHPTAGDMNGLAVDFDDVCRGYDHARHMGRVVAGAVMQVYDKVNYVPVNSLKAVQKVIEVPSNRPDPADLPLAREYDALHQAGRDAEIPYKGMMLTTVVAEAGRMLRLEHGPDSFPMILSGIAIGNVALLGIPGEPFSGIGRALKQAPGWDMVLPCCIANGYEGYFPMKDSYQEGGYEARSSNFKAGVAELIIEEGTALLHQLHQ